MLYWPEMSVLKKWELISESDYLDRELVSEHKHEYNAGVVYAMAGAKNRHNRIVTNLTASLWARLRRSPCQPFNSDTKVRIRLAMGNRYYYPDAMVVCSPNPDGDSYQDAPVVIVEVLSDSTRRIDEGEKKDAYLTIPGLGVYLMVEQDFPLVVVHRCGPGGFHREVIEGLESVIPLPEIETELSLSEIYEAVNFSGDFGTE
jgi:Uma2 family endonuclease